MTNKVIYNPDYACSSLDCVQFFRLKIFLFYYISVIFLSNSPHVFYFLFCFVSFWNVLPFISYAPFYSFCLWVLVLLCAFQLPLVTKKVPVLKVWFEFSLLKNNSYLLFFLMQPHCQTCICFLCCWSDPENTLAHGCLLSSVPGALECPSLHKGSELFEMDFVEDRS